MLNNVVKVLMAANDLTPTDIISSSGIPKSSFYKDGGLSIEEISSIFNISDINVAILNRLDDNAYSYKQLLFEALRCYLYNSSISNSTGECHRGKAIKSIRKAEGLNISEASKITGIATSIICQTEKGHIEFSLNNIRKYSKTFDILSSEIVRLLELEEDGYSYPELLFEVLGYYFEKHPEEKQKQKVMK